MKKLLFTLIFFSILQITASPSCTSWHKKNELGTIIENKGFSRSDCTCKCNTRRTEKNICLECKHGHSRSTVKAETNRHNKNFAIDFVETFAIDFVKTFSGDTRSN
jgi:hypothetical protein